MWTEKDIPSLKGKTIFITGANSGIGFHKARHLAKNNAQIIIGARSLERGNQAREKIVDEYKEADISVVQLDLGSKSSIEQCATYIKAKHKKIDVLLNNAGIMTTPYHPTENGFESQIGVNHLGHFYLTYLLFDLLKESNDARIINTASIAHNFGSIKPSSFVYKDDNRYNKQKAYAQSKLANLLFTYKLARMVDNSNLNIKVLASHPGISKTNLGRHIRGNFFTEFVLWFAGILRQPGAKGSLPGLLATVDENAINGDYYGPRGLFHTKGYPKKQKSNRKSQNEKLQDTLWIESERMLDIQFSL